MADAISKGSKISTSSPVDQSSSSSYASVDRISDLPESLIADILSSLTTKEAVATSILSRSWRFRWTNVTSFNFDNRGEEYKNQIREFLTSFDFDDQIGDGEDDGVEAMDFEEFTDMVLHYHSGEPISKFVLVSESYNFWPYINGWVSTAIAQNVRHLQLKTVSTETEHWEIHLPSLLYSSGTLEVLKLEGPFLISPPNVVSLPKLSEMVLIAVIYESDGAVPMLLSGCPVLYFLTIERRSMWDNMVVCVISSPVLKHLHIKLDHQNLTMVYRVGFDLKLKIDAPALESLYVNDIYCSHICIEPSSVKIVAFDISFKTSQSVVVELLRALASVKFLTLHFFAMIAIDYTMQSAELEAQVARGEIQPSTTEAEYEEVGTIAARATLPSFERLTKLIIDQPDWCGRWSTVAYLVDACINLEELTIWWVGHCRRDWRDPDRVPRCLLTSLKRLALAGFDGSEDSIAVLKFFLKHGLVMERVILCFKLEYMIRPEIVKEVFELSRASPACQISCQDGSKISRCSNVFED